MGAVAPDSTTLGYKAQKMTLKTRVATELHEQGTRGRSFIFEHKVDD